jgi:hypothetical protein
MPRAGNPPELQIALLLLSASSVTDMFVTGRWCPEVRTEGRGGSG